MITEILAGLIPATSAMVTVGVLLMVVLMTGLTAFSVRMLSGPAVWVPLSTPAPSSTAWTVEEWTYPNGTVRRVMRSEMAR